MSDSPEESQKHRLSKIRPHDLVRLIPSVPKRAGPGLLRSAVQKLSLVVIGMMDAPKARSAIRASTAHRRATIFRFPKVIVPRPPIAVAVPLYREVIRRPISARTPKRAGRDRRTRHKHCQKHENSFTHRTYSLR